MHCFISCVHTGADLLDAESTGRDLLRWALKIELERVAPLEIPGVSVQFVVLPHLCRLSAEEFHWDDMAMVQQRRFIQVW